MLDGMYAVSLLAVALKTLSSSTHLLLLNKLAPTLRLAVPPSSTAATRRSRCSGSRRCSCWRRRRGRCSSTACCT